MAAWAAVRALSADPYAEPSLLFRGFAGPRFEEVDAARRYADAAGRQRAERRRSATSTTTAAIDIVVVNRDSRPYLLHNVVKSRGHWMMLRVVERRTVATRSAPR